MFNHLMPITYSQLRFIYSSPSPLCTSFYFFFFNDTATTEIYTLSLHDALPILPLSRVPSARSRAPQARSAPAFRCADRKSTRLNSSHGYISYAVFCLKKKKQIQSTRPIIYNQGQ